jgi:hypothetical protein
LLEELTIDLFDIEEPLYFEDCWLLSLEHYGKVTEVLTFDAGLLKRVGLWALVCHYQDNYLGFNY